MTILKISPIEKRLATKKLSGKAISSPSTPGGISTSQSKASNGLVDETSPKRIKIPRVHSLAMLEKKKCSMPRLPSFQDGIKELRPFHAYLDLSPPDVKLEKYNVTPWASPIKEKKGFDLISRKALDGNQLVAKLRELQRTRNSN